MGRLIPSGTGSAISKLRQVSTHRDNLIIQEKQKAEELEDSSDSPELPPEVAENAADERSTDDIPVDE